MSELIDRNEALKSISNDGGIQYPRWWYVKQIEKVPEVQPAVLAWGKGR